MGAHEDVGIRSARSRDFRGLLALLESAGLPTEGLPPSLVDFLVAEAGGRLVGGVGLEVYDRVALLRSAIVAPALRGSGVGGALIQRLLAHARARGVRELYLLTTTADGWFLRFGFLPIARPAVPAGLHASAEFQGSCPDTAVIMRAVL